MRVCTPHCGLDPETRLGGEMYELEVLREMAARGTVFDILLARHKRSPEDVRNWVIHRLPFGRGLRWPVAAVVLPPFIKRVWDRTPFDVLRVHSLRYIGPAAIIARRRYRLDVPIVAHHHHLDPGWLNPLIESRVLRAANRVVVGSDFTRRQATAELGVSPDKMTVVPYGVDRAFRPGPKPEALARRLGVAGRPVALFLGGLQPRKNLHLLLDAWHEVGRSRPEAVLLIAGAGRLLGALRRHARRLGDDGRVVFTGHVPASEKVAYYNLADLMLFPSMLEGFGLAVAEAMSCAVPAVVSNQGSLPELVVDGDSGLVCDPLDRVALVGRTLRLLSDAGLRRRLGEGARERVDRFFRWDVCAAATARVYEDVVDEWRARRASGRR